jgi:hypothetical protein
VRRLRVVLSVLLVVAASVAVGVTSGGASTTVTYMNPRAPIQARVGDLLRRMTMKEKVGQMDQIVVEVLRPRPISRRATSELAVTAGDIDGAVRPGDYQVQVGSESVGFTIH